MFSKFQLGRFSRSVLSKATIMRAFISRIFQEFLQAQLVQEPALQKQKSDVKIDFPSHIFELCLVEAKVQ